MIQSPSLGSLQKLKKDVRDNSDKVHGVLHTFVDGGEALFVEIDMRALTRMDRCIIRVNVVDIVIKMELCPSTDEL